jgi:hypothetical protein
LLLSIDGVIDGRIRAAGYPDVTREQRTWRWSWRAITHADLSLRCAYTSMQRFCRGHCCASMRCRATRRANCRGPSCWR